MVNPNRFYTYAYLREDKTPYYVGKGKEDRAYYKRKGEVYPPKDKSRIILLKQNLTEEEAFKHEIYMISVFGRKDLGTGILRNRTDGGEGVSNQGTPEQRSEIARKRNASKTPEQRSEIARKREANKTPEQRSEKARKSAAKLTPEQWSEISRKMSDSKKDKNWWTDGFGNTKFMIECPEEGWVRGRGKLKMSKTDPEST